MKHKTTTDMQTTTKTNIIAKFLLLEKEDYLEQNIERYLRWCIDKANQFDIELQLVVANSAIANYYKIEFDRLEDAFIKEATPIYQKVKYTTMRKLYSEQVIEIFNAYPKPLLEKAKRMQIINHLYN
jgi:hypothetical protein